MSLQLWLPMTKDLTQQGLQTVSATNVGATLDNNGKLGKCYSFNGNGNYLLFNYGLPKTVNTWSYCCWAKLVNNSTVMCLYSQRTTTTDDQRTIFIAQGKVFYFDDGVRIQGSLNTSADLTQWNHYAFIRNGNSLKIYINGIETVSTTISSTPATVGSYTMIGASQSANTTPSGNSLYGYLNDIRLYDHALSPKEIEILSRGLVCHYPLNGSGRGQKNEVKNGAFTDSSGNLTGWNNWGACTIRQVDTVNGVNYAHIKTSGTKWAGLLQNLGTPLDVSSDYILSFRAFSPTSHSMCFGFHWCNSSGSIISQSWFEQSLTTNSTYYTIKIRSGSTVDRFNMMIGWNTDEVAEIYFTDVKIEKGTVPTVYMPHSSDSAYTTMGYDSTTEYDVSGYGNNMTKTGTITYTSDSARYSVASHFINGSYILATKNCPDYLPTDGLTVNLWIKATTWGTPISCTEGGGWNIESYNNGLQFQCMITSVGYKPAWCNVTATSITDNKWHMLTGTFDRTAQQTKFYIDGVLKGTGNTGSTNGVGYASNRLIISGEAQSTTPASSTFVGEESDVRIYATALSAAQVAELYNTAVSVANNGTLMGYELVEV